MIYVMSDLHGMVDKYKMMLEKLNLQPEDALFVLGDVIDKGEDGIKILADMRYRPNIYPVLGEHEYFAKKLLPVFEDADSKEECESLLTGETKSLYDLWLMSGGEPTLEGFLNLSGEDREASSTTSENLSLMSRSKQQEEATFWFTQASTDLIRKKHLMIMKNRTLYRSRRIYQRFILKTAILFPVTYRPRIYQKMEKQG